MHPRRVSIEVWRLRVSGSAAAVWWATASQYLALLHTKDRRGRYVTLAYTFAPRPP